MDADAAMPMAMPGSGGSSVEREPGAAVCAPAPNFELLCAIYLKWYCITVSQV